MSPPKFSYYKSLSVDQKRIYDKSDKVTRVRFPVADSFRPYVKALEKTLASEDKPRTQLMAQKFVSALCDTFKVPRVSVRVLARRPSEGWGEMHGLYEAEEGKNPVLTVWMRTAKRKQVVAFRTFLRTIVHEFVHHLDFALLKLDESFHTEGFYKRESIMVKQLLGEFESHQ